MRRMLTEKLNVHEMIHQLLPIPLNQRTFQVQDVLSWAAWGWEKEARV